MPNLVKTGFRGLEMSRYDMDKFKAMTAADPSMCVQYILDNGTGTPHYISECQGVEFCTKRLGRWRGTLSWRKHYHTRRDAEAKAKAEQEAKEKEKYHQVLSSLKNKMFDDAESA